MEKIETFISLKSIKDFLKEESDSFSQQQFQDFVNYLEIDFYDWLKANLDSFLIHQANKKDDES